MLQNIAKRYKENPMFYYAMSIVASWAGVGSLMNFRTIALESGAVPAIIWAVFNSFACILFGLLAAHLPYIRKIMQTKAMSYFIGFLTVFQTWTQMSGIREIFADTPIGSTGGTIIAYASCALFMIVLLKNGMIRNVLSDDLSWVIVYGLLAATVAESFIYTKGDLNTVATGLNADGIKNGIVKGLLLLPGPFTYPYYYTLFGYNEKNDDGTNTVDVKKSFIVAGIMFGVYMILAAVLTWVKFSPALNVIKAVLITIIALSSVSTYLYSEYIVFGKKAGAAIDLLTIGTWQFLIPLGVMGIWTLMSEIRVYIVLAVILVATFLKWREHRRAVSA